MNLQQTGRQFCFGGEQLQYQHDSKVLHCSMNFSIFLPPQANQRPVPLLYWLSGLTCSDENFVQKAGAQRYATEHGIAIVCPDTSPRGDDVPDDPAGEWDFGLGAGFYVNATETPYSKHYHMYDYIVGELPSLLESDFPIDANRISISGHSMGGHGAIIIALKNPQRFKSISAFAPICSPLHCPWGEKALGNYLGNDRNTWIEYDSCELIKNSEEKLPLLVDQGEADGFLEQQLKPELLEQACADNKRPLILRRHSEYDHSYFFIASFIGDHIAFHARYLNTR